MKLTSASLLLAACGLGWAVSNALWSGEPVALPSPCALPDRDEQRIETNYIRIDNVIREEVGLHAAVVDSSTPVVSVREGQDADDEWNRLPRGSSPKMLVGIMYNQRLTVEPERLFRHRVLNPRDVYIPRAVRASLPVALAGSISELDSVYTLYHETVTLEMNMLVADGKKHPLQFNDKPETIAFLRKHPPQPGVLHLKPQLYVDGDRVDVFCGIGGTLYGFSNTDAPRILGLVDYLNFLRFSIATQIGQWFVSVGALGSAELNGLLAEASDAMSSHSNNSKR
jgi:hypothetical protein